MAVYQLVRYQIRADARADAERAMHAHAAQVRDTLPDVMWTTYRDPHAPSHYVSLIRCERGAPDLAPFEAALAPFLAGSLEITDCELVTSSDLGRRHRQRGR